MSQQLDQRLGSLERRHTDLKEKTAEEQLALEERTAEDLRRLTTTVGGLEKKHESFAQEHDRTQKDSTRRVDQIYSELSNRLEVSSGEVSGLENDIKRSSKKLDMDIQAVKRTSEGRLDELALEIKVNLGQKVTTLEVSTHCNPRHNLCTRAVSERLLCVSRRRSGRWRPQCSSASA